MTKEIPNQLYFKPKRDSLKLSLFGLKYLSFKSLFHTYRPRITLNIIEIKAKTSSI